MIEKKTFICLFFYPLLDIFYNFGHLKCRYTPMILPVAIVISICFLLGSSLWFIRRKDSKSKSRDTMIAILMMIIAYTELITFVYKFPFYNKILFLTYTDALVFYLYSPFLYIYFLNLLEGRSFFHYKNAIHTLVAAPGLIYVVNFNTLSQENQLLSLNTKYCGSLSDNWLFIFGMTTALFYTILTISKIHRYLSHNSNNLANQSINQLNRYSWICFFQIILIIVFSTLLIILPTEVMVQQAMMILLLLLSVVVVAIGYIIETKPLEIIDTQTNKQTTKKQTITRNDIQDKLIENISDYIAKKQRYRDQHLDISTLAKELAIPPHKLSVILNSWLNTTFPDYINHFRVEYAKERLLATDSLNIKMDYLALECGFSSRSNFYAVFKKMTGQTPTEFRKSYLAEAGKIKAV